jgi:predicted AlkP superfamily phosphohydrolase/phosphomutase
MAEGSYGKLRSTIPPLTCPAWVSSCTGVNIGKHGIHDFRLSVDVRKREMVFADSTKRKVEAIWNILSAAGKRVVVLNFPVSYPPERVNGAMVSGMLTPSTRSNFTFPKGLKYELSDLGYQIDIADTMIDNMLAFKANKFDFLSRIREVVNSRIRAAEYLMREFEWDLFIVVFVALDRIYHQFWKYIDPSHIAYNAEEAKVMYPNILRCHSQIDTAIKSLLKLAGNNTNVVIHSDHGFKPLNKTFFTNSMLLRMGLLKLKGSRRMGILPTQEAIVRKMAQLHIGQVMSKLSSQLKRRVRTLIQPSKEFSDIFEIEQNETKAFQSGYGSIEVNKDIVSSVKEYEKVREYIINLFKERPFNTMSIRAYRKEELYHGPALGDLPDVVLLSEKDITLRRLIPANNMLTLNYDETINIPSLMWNGDHDLLGTILMYGPRIRRNCPITDANIIDIAPTILYLIDEPVPTNMDGKVIKEGLKLKNCERGASSRTP